MNPDIQLHVSLSKGTLPRCKEAQLVYVLVEAIPQGATAARSRLPLNLCLVLDRSSSMRGERLLHVKEAARRIVDQMESSDYFSLITFNDRAQVVIPAQRVSDKSKLKNLIGTVEAAGGTEMATGLDMAVREIDHALLMNSINHIILLTDGRTYGDESACVQIVRRAQDRGTGLTALGVGEEWNEDLLETMAARENSHTQYIASTLDITQVFADEVKRMHSIFAQKVQFLVEGRSDCTLRSLDRVLPFIAPLPLQEEHNLRWLSKLGDWPSTDTHAFLLEVVVPPLAPGNQQILHLILRYDMPGVQAQGQQQEKAVSLKIQASDEVSESSVDSTVKHWLERLTAYRLQDRAWKNVAAGSVREAAQQLQMAGTRLFGVGEADLAQTVQDEATRLLQSGNTSAKGRKRIKYGTRGLMKDAAQ